MDQVPVSRGEHSGHAKKEFTNLDVLCSCTQTVPDLHNFGSADQSDFG